MERDQELEKLYAERQLTITQLAVLTDLQAWVKTLAKGELIGGNGQYLAQDSIKELILNFVDILVTIEARVDCLKAHCHPLGDFIAS